MYKQAFERGFIKAAMSQGLSEWEAVQLLKRATDQKPPIQGTTKEVVKQFPGKVTKPIFDNHFKTAGENSSGVGRYFASKALRTQAISQHPGKAIIGATPGMLPYAGLPISLLGGTEMASSRLALGGPEDRNKAYETADKELKENSYGQNAHQLGKSWAGPQAILGGVAGGALGALYPWVAPNGGTPTTADHINSGLAGAGLGLLGGAGIGYLSGGAGGLVNKFIANHTSDESRQRAGAMKAKHPYATALPFGDMVGAAKS